MNSSRWEDVMTHFVRTMFCIGTVSLLFACSSAPLAKQPPEWSYEKDAISLHFTGAPQLNLFQKQAHSLIICTE
jgi:predicted component of type VI protein secretion system